MKANCSRLKGLLLSVILLLSTSFAVLEMLVHDVSGESEPWWNINWPFRKAITINGTLVEGHLESFPVLIDIADNDLKGKALPDGSDVAFIDDNGTQLSHEIELYDDSTGHLVAWVNLPELPSGEYTDIYMYYGNSVAESQQEPTLVWNPNYVMVQHLEEESQARYDSTANGNDGTVYGTSKTPMGKIDGADEFDGADYLIVANDPSLNPPSAVTIEAWLDISTTGNYINLLQKGLYNQYYLRLGRQEGRVFWFVRFDDGTYKLVDGYVDWTVTTWHYLVATVDTGTQIAKVYVDGVERLSGTFGPGKSIAQSTSSLLISDTQRSISGALDEIRLSNVSRLPEYIFTSYNNQFDPDAFYTVGIEESYGADFPPTLFGEKPTSGAIEVYTNPTLSVSVVDFDGDAMNVTFSVNATGTWENIQTYQNVGDGTYSTIPAGMNKLGTQYYWAVSATDGNNWANETYSLTTTSTVLEHKWTTTDLGKGHSGVLIADVVGNSLEEVIHAAEGKVSVLNGTNGSIIWSVSDSNIGEWTQPQAADLDCDGILEILVPLLSPAGLLVLHGNNGTTYWRIDSGLGLESYSSPVVADIDDDGYPTVFFASTDIHDGLNGTGRITSLSHDGKVLHQVFAWRPCSGGLSIADTDGDGEHELYVGDRNSGYGKGTISLWASNLTERWHRDDIMESSNIPMLADVNNDGTLDVIVGHHYGGLAVFNSGDGSTIEKTVGIPEDAPVHYQPSVYDIDGDGNLEIMMADGTHSSTSDDIVVWDLSSWSVDAKLDVGLCQYGPQVADVTGDGQMEMIAANYTAIFVFRCNHSTGEFSLVDSDTNLRYALNYAVTQDIDGDGYNEVVVSSAGGKRVYAYDTPARSQVPRVRTEVQFCSERRLGVSRYLAPPSQEISVGNPSPKNETKNLFVSTPKIRFTLFNHRHAPMNYTVETFPNIGSANATDVTNGRYSFTISNLSHSTEYIWVIQVTDGEVTVNRTYVFSTESDDPWWNHDWKYRKAIVIDKERISGSLASFPIVIDTIDADLASKARSEGEDIVVISQSDEMLDYEIELYNHTTGHLVMWVDVPVLSSSSELRLYLYYGNPNAESNENPSVVWNSNYVVVQHLNEEGTLRIDSTSHGNDATAHGTVEKSVAGKLDGADTLSVDDYLSIPDSFTLNPPSGITIELWMNLSQTGRYIDLSNKNSYYQFYLRAGHQEGRIFWLVRFDDGTAASVSGYIGWKFNSWHHIIATVNTSTNEIKVYLDGALKINDSFDPGKNLAVTGAPLHISSASDRDFVGTIDEFRISNISRTADWILTSYNNQRDPSTFYTIGPEESTSPSFTDSFDDNTTDFGFWQALEKKDGLVSEVNGRVECSTPAPPFNTSSTAGYITATSHNLSDRDIQVEVSNQNFCEAALAITLDGINDHFWYSANFYTIEKHRWSETCKVKRRINNGTRIYLYDGNWTGPDGSLGISIHNGIIYFYEEEHLRYSEPFNLSSLECYIHFEANTWNQSYSGIDYFDNFRLSFPPEYGWLTECNDQSNWTASPTGLAVNDYNITVENDEYFKVSVTCDVATDEYLNYDCNITDVSSDLYDRYMLRWRTSESNTGVGAKAILVFTDGSQTILPTSGGTPQFSLGWYTTSGTITAGKTIDSVRFIADDYPDSVDSGTFYVYFDFLILY